ncbi:MAG: YtfJ family protein [Candidatus Thiodiazotropha sp.]
MAMTLFRIAILLACTSAFGLNLARAAEVGEILEPVKLADVDDVPTDIPDFGTKVLVIFYNDADRADLNDPLADAIKAADFDQALFRGIGIANLKDSKAPNFIIRGVIRGKIEKYDSTILTDPDRRLPNAWDLGNCNNDSIVMLVGKDRKLERTQRGGVRGEDIDAWIAHLRRLLTPPVEATVPSELSEGQAAISHNRI